MIKSFSLSLRRKTNVRIIIMVNKLSTLLLMLVICISCSDKETEKGFMLNGVWKLCELQSPNGNKFIYGENERTWMRIYDDRCYYVCQIETAPNGTMVTPIGMEAYTFIEKGRNDVLYLQGDDLHPLTIVNDSTMIIQETGHRYTWRICRDLEEERCADIAGIIRKNVENRAESTPSYVFSKAEKKLKTVNHTLIYLLIFIFVALTMCMNYVHRLYQNKKRVELELMRIEQERQTMPEPVRKALDTVESDFHRSDFYLSLRKRISQGERLKRTDWDAIEEKFKIVYPRFASTLMSLYAMSLTEYQVCLLLKLNATPSEIANVLCKDISSISTTRSRLYQKVFGKKGSSKDWDEFIHSL